MSTIILKVDLECCKCNKKIRKTICKLQDRWKIQTINYAKKNDTVTISGPFDAKKLYRELFCKACKVITDIKIPEPPPLTPPVKPPEPPPTTPPVKPRPPPPAPVCQPVCCCWYHGECRCCWCGRAYGAVSMKPPPPVVYNVPCCDGCNNSNNKSCQIICVDQEPSSCTIM